METILMIPRELEHLESLVRLARRKKDSEAMNNQVSMVSVVPALKKIYINKIHQSITLHLLVDINNCVVEGLVDIGASMSIMAITVVKELGIMHLVTGSKIYKNASRIKVWVELTKYLLGWRHIVHYDLYGGRYKQI
jgi:hypothetical protein